MTEKPKFCTKCRFSFIVFSAISPSVADCKHPESRIGVDRVTGRVAYNSCSFMRGVNGTCGETGALFEPRFFARLRDRLKNCWTVLLAPSTVNKYQEPSK